MDVKCPLCGRAEVREQETEPIGSWVTRRIYECAACSGFFDTYEINGELWGRELSRRVWKHEKILAERTTRSQRNEVLTKRIVDGEKHAALGEEFGLSDNMVTTIALELGLRSAQKTTVYYEFEGKKYTLREVGLMLGLSRRQLRWRWDTLGTFEKGKVWKKLN